MRILVIHGPNLNLLGRREPAIYGYDTLADIEVRLRARAGELAVDLDTFQSNHEGAIVDRIQAAVLAEPHADGLVINPAAYTHTSVAIRDAIAAVALPAWEVHLSDPATREGFRRVSYVRDVCVGHTAGRGADGYLEALAGLVEHLRGPGART
ncbi:MAG TPA: type II 3-dehydroquinate dehydratase [Candidatus Krumholzibacteria bacterium]|nr:type II 3-dehydroquinate dehydratase [Candidatus Krumholzibacteria bacterium]HPD72215.1 type II 3-dehydroquinate dehydratase [Candidatus Krumholzibacteria bacterium]HRY40853.1 type II 3-dehydroquinate dehydratase [Candidatus Krumholzibacteria bacterium]